MSVSAEEMIWQGMPLLRLTCDELTAYVNLLDGCNVCMLHYKNRQIIPFQKERQETKKTYGIPILFPTPNRTRDHEFLFHGIRSEAVMHGIVKNHAFSLENLFTEGNKAGMTGALEIGPAGALYEMYPYHCRLTATITVSSHSLNYRFDVENLDSKPMPYGIGLHPFFHLNMDKTKVKLQADAVMEKDEAFLPTGHIVRTAGTKYDLSDWKKSTQLELDDVYLCNDNNPKAQIRDNKSGISINTDEFFKHMVVYTPEGAPFLCVEPQSCSTDAINMYTKGHEALSGLCVLEAGTKHSSEVSFSLI